MPFFVLYAGFCGLSWSGTPYFVRWKYGFLGVRLFIQGIYDFYNKQFFSVSVGARTKQQEKGDCDHGGPSGYTDEYIPPCPFDFDHRRRLCVKDYICVNVFF